MRILVAAAILLALAAGPAAGATTATAEEASAGADSELFTEPIESKASRDTEGRVLSTYYCRTLSVARVHKTFLGFVAFKFWQRKRWCWDYPKILSNSVSTYVTDVDANYEYKGVISAWGEWYVWCCKTKYSGHASFREGKFVNCVLKIGCVGTYYPWVKIRAHSNGSYSYDTGS